MAFRPDTATLSVVLASESHSVSDVRFVMDALDGIVSAGVWGALAIEDPPYEQLRLVRSILEEETHHPKAGSRFFPSWGALRAPEADDLPEPVAFDPREPLDAGLRDGLNSFLRRSIMKRDPRLYSQLFGFATVERIEHHSPLLIEFGVVITAAIAVPAILVCGVMRAAYSVRKADAEARIREAEAKIREEELDQKRLQTRILSEIADAAEELGPTGIPREAIAKAAEVSTTAVSDLGTSPFIGNLTLGFSSKSS